MTVVNPRSYVPVRGPARPDPPHRTARDSSIVTSPVPEHRRSEKVYGWTTLGNGNACRSSRELGGR